MQKIVHLHSALGLLLMACAYSVSAFASHPNEGSVTLPALLEAASAGNIEIKEEQKQLEAFEASKKQSISGFLPQVSVEGGYQSTRFDEETSKGAVAFGLATLNLYRGGKDSAFRNFQSKELEFQKIRLEKVKGRTEREISKRYYELLYILEGRNLKEQAITANKTQMAIAERKRGAGYTSQADVLEFELREATLRSDLNFLEREETIKEHELKRIIGRSSDDPLHVSGHLGRIQYVKSSNDLLKLALLEREDLQEAEKNIVLSELSYRSFLGDFLPRVDFEGKYGKLINEERVFTQNNNYSLGLKVSIPIFSGLDTVYARESKAKQISGQELAAERIRQGIKVDLENALIRLKSVGERLDLEEKNIERSQRYYEITLGEYKRGVKNSPDVAGAAERFFDSRLRNLEYRRDYFLALIEVAESVGISTSSLMTK